jgi:uncharacterized protein (DUF885 family)
MPENAVARVAELSERTVREAFAAHPEMARYSGAHQYDGVLGDIGDDVARRRIAELDRLIADLASVHADGLDAEARADLETARRATELERFHLVELRDPWSDPRHALVAADASVYVSRPYAPASQRAAALCRHLEQLPEYLEAGAAILEAELPMGPRQIAVEEARGHAAFYRDEVRAELGPLDDDLARRLDRAIETGASACESYAVAVEGRGSRDDLVLGADRFCAMLQAQEGVAETATGLRARADHELNRLIELTAEVVAQVGSGDGLDAAFERMEREHPQADALVSTAADMLDRLRDFWTRSGVVSIDPQATCTVRPSPAFMSWVTAAYENPGPLEPPGLEHFYYVTTVRPEWSETQVEEWLRHLNFASLENISVHEVYPGHFVHAVCGLRQPSLLRRVYWFSGFGEGWAHYTEQLAVEQGLAEGKPLLHLAMLQDALLRACRFSATVGMHTEGMTLEEATRLFTDHAHIPRHPAEREALRATHDPMYLVYSYGKLEILRWREELGRRPQFSLRRFHDRMLESGFPPLSVVRDYLYADGVN